MDSVKVALRIRPMVNSEIEIGCKQCIEKISDEPQVSIGKGNQMFTYNYVFDEHDGQNKVYEVAVKPLIDNLFKGYNVTILAYGQTGSGKTFTMGTNYSGQGELGVIPRAVYDIFETINQSSEDEYQVSVSFIELYNESLYDLLTRRPREQSIVDMRDCGNGICITGLTDMEVTSPDETLDRLNEGSLGRVVGSTAMNAQSSRSHAIFTVNIKITPKDSKNVMTSKFHLVDLAGSERSKKTGTTGDRFKEGVNINRGLLVLGNVISQLGEANHGYINYRDSKLTRLLQDSLGGNSVTLMIACVSPADYNQEETLSTLRYADRARKIKNKPIVNQDPRLAEIARLKKEIAELRLGMIGEGSIIDCPPEHKVLQVQLSDSQKKVHQLSKALSEALVQNTDMYEKAISIENAEKMCTDKLAELSKLIESLPKDDPKNKEIYEKLAEVQSQKEKVEIEIIGLDKTGGNNEEDKYNTDDDSESPDDSISELRQEHIIQQAKMNKEFLTLSKNLLWKEKLIAKLTENSGQLDCVSKETIDELKKQLSEVQQEKDELLQKIRFNSNSQNNSAKIAETRRKKLQELEAKVATLSKKLLDQERVIKTKEKSEAQIKALKNEIMSMKQMKVKLIQQMRGENEKFNSFKAKKEKEVCQLRNMNLKKQNQLQRMEQMHSMQQNVLKRKLEAAAAANKRIMAVLEKQKSARQKHNSGPSKERIKDRISEELELYESEYHAEKSLDNLLQDRAALTQEMAIVKESLEDDSVSSEEKVKLSIDLKKIEHDLEMRSAEISDLQQKLFDLHQDDHNRNNWDMLQSMSDAKFALSYLHGCILEKLKENLNKDATISELKDQQSEMQLQLVDYKAKLMNLEAHYKKSLDTMEKECEEKVYVFMKLASENSKQSEVSETFKKEVQELEKVEALRKRIEELEEENKRLISNKNDESTADPFGKFLEERMGISVVSPGKKRGKKTLPKEKESNKIITEEQLKYLDDSMEVDEDDLENDPDWRKTPINRRVKALKRVKLRKRTTDDYYKCECTGNCGSDCICIKSSLICNENCCCDMTTCFEKSKRPRPSRMATVGVEDHKLDPRKISFED